MNTTVSAPGKLVVLGEYVVLEGAPALVTAVDRRARVHLASQEAFSLSAPDLSIAHASFELTGEGVPHFDDAALDAKASLGLVRHVMQFAYQTAQAAGVALQPCHVQLDTSAFFLAPGGPKLGLGSSAALATALLVGLLGRAGMLQALLPARSDTQRHNLMVLAQAAHAAAQGGGGSGVDVAASVWGGLVRFSRDREAGPQASRLKRLSDMQMLAVWAGEPASTPQMLAQIATFKSDKPQEYWEIYEKLGIYANAGVEFWALGNTPALLTVIDAFYEALKTLGDASGAPIVTPAHRAIHQLARAGGCFYKSSGAGGGDMGLAFCPSQQSAERLRTRLDGRGFKVVPLRIDDAGVDIDFDIRRQHGPGPNSSIL